MAGSWVVVHEHHGGRESYRVREREREREAAREREWGTELREERERERSHGGAHWSTDGGVP